MKVSIPLLGVFLIAACDNSSNTGNIDGRWYSQAQVEQGRDLFAIHCAVCHGVNAEGTAVWTARNEDGSYPPPPLDGSAHAWHHPLPVLLRVVENGGVPLGGVMPGFGAVLSEEEQRAVIAYFQSKWSEEIYEQWESLDERYRASR